MEEIRIFGVFFVAIWDIYDAIWDIGAQDENINFSSEQKIEKN